MSTKQFRFFLFKICYSILQSTQLISISEQERKKQGFERLDVFQFRTKTQILQGGRHVSQKIVSYIPSAAKWQIFNPKVHSHKMWGSVEPVREVRWFQRCSLTTLKNVILLATLGFCSEVYRLEGVFASHVLNVHCLSCQFGFVLLDSEAITVSLFSAQPSISVPVGYK